MSLSRGCRRPVCGREAPAPVRLRVPADLRVMSDGQPRQQEQGTTWAGRGASSNQPRGGVPWGAGQPGAPGALGH